MVDPSGDPKAEGGRRTAFRYRSNDEGQSQAVLRRVAAPKLTQAVTGAQAVEAAVSRYGKLDILINNAGISLRKRIEDTAEEDWDRIMAINAKGVFLETKRAIPAMRQSGGGSIINISSTAGLVGSPYSGASYAATKGMRPLMERVLSWREILGA